MVNFLFSPMIIAARMNKYFFRYKNAEATHPGNAKSLKSLGLDAGLIFDKLVKNEVFVETSPGAYYVNEDNYQRLKTQRRAKAFLVIAALLLLVAINLVFISW